MRYNLRARCTIYTVINATTLTDVGHEGPSTRTRYNASFQCHRQCHPRYPFIGRLLGSVLTYMFFIMSAGYHTSNAMAALAGIMLIEASD